MIKEAKLAIWAALLLAMAIATAGCVSKPGDVTKNEIITTPIATDITPPSTPVDESQNVNVELPSSIKLQSLGAYSSSNGTIRIPSNLYIHSYPLGVKGYYIVQFKGPIYEEYKAQVTSLGGELFGFIREHAFIVKMNNSTKSRVQKSDIVQWVGIYQPAYKIQPGLLNEKGDVILNIIIFSGENITEISHELESIDGMISVSSEDFFKTRINASKIPKIANIYGVMWIEKYSMPTIFDGRSGIK